MHGGNLMRTVEWDNGLVKMIDQRLLPGTFEIAEFNDYREVARAIKDMYIRGAPAIGAAAGFGMALAAFQSDATDRLALLRDLEVAAEVLRDRIKEWRRKWAVRYPDELVPLHECEGVFCCRQDDNEAVEREYRGREE